MEPIARTLNSEAETSALGAELALFVRPGMTVCLHGEIGAGKTTLARALIRALSDDKDQLDVPSPTFSLLQPYEETRITVHHFDLYRITDVNEAHEIGLYDNLEDRLTIIEWPERLEGDLPDDRIELALAISGTGRTVTITAVGQMQKVVERMVLVSNFLTSGDWKAANRAFLQGDASSRRYERLTLENGKRAILMDMPEAPDGPVIKDGKTYSDIAHIAEGIFPVAAINNFLHQQGFSAPRSLQRDLPNGLMVIEDLGSLVYGDMIQTGADMSEPMTAATQLLAHMAACHWPEVVMIDSTEHHIPPFDLAAFKMEASLLLDWFWPMVSGDDVAIDIRQSFEEHWENVFPLTRAANPVWVLRDFHSPNLIWLPGRNGIERVGLIDTQDCLLGHPAYDLVSMLQDARVDLPTGCEETYYQAYCQQRSKQNHAFDDQEFAAAYAILGAQRATKILGIFARLNRRDGKPGYLKHLPRVSAALEKNLQHPSLADLAEWYQTHLPADRRKVE